MSLAAPEMFAFPFTPYDIQVKFMKALFSTLEQGQLGIFESPTGTGKSMSIICGALTWLQIREKTRLEELSATIDAGQDTGKEDEADDDDWLAEAIKQQAKDEERRKAKLELNFLKKKQERMEELRRRRKSVKRASVQKTDSEFDELFKDLQDVQKAVRKELMKFEEKNDAFDDQDEEIIVDEYVSDDEESTISDGQDERQEEDHSVRIFYCSRTHSQLSQFVKEVQKSPFADDIRLVSLASRNLTCINESVRNLGSVSLINERCLELQRKGSLKQPTDGRGNKGSRCKCPFYKQSAISVLGDNALLQVMDIEQLVISGRKVKGCPYYASRHAIGDAQIVILPYNSLLHKPTREVMGINLKNSVVIVDEAHNLLDTLAHIHSIEIRRSQLTQAKGQVQRYLDRYRSRLKAKNLLYIKQIIFILTNFVSLLGCRSPEDTRSRLVKVEEFFRLAEVFNINLFKLIKYIEKSNLAHKLRSFTAKYKEAENVTKEPKPEKGLASYLKSLEQNSDDARDKPKETSTSDTTTLTTPLLAITEFLKAISKVPEEARILLTSSPASEKSLMKYCLMNPSSEFQDLVSQCRSVIVAGGTMQPISEFKERLFVSAGADPNRILHFSCDHVIPEDNLLPMVICKGPTGRTLDFSFESRNAVDTMKELCSVLSNVCNIVPGGIVCFLPSYEYEHKLFKFLEDNGKVSSLQQRKPIFREPKKSTDLESVLHKYSVAAKTTGALLMSVVGGKMSEGINFSDDLGRAVVMVGMPYPNSKSVELQEKMVYLNKTCPKLEDGRTPGQAHYENLCMKAVNQSIGRAIRHKEDYSVILLLDHRYQRPSVTGQLPGWIRKHVEVVDNFPKAIPKIRQFFKAKK